MRAERRCYGKQEREGARTSPKDVPTVMVPLMEGSDVEGYLMLLGKRAETAFLDRQERSESLAEDLAQLIRERRLSRWRHDTWKPAGGMLVKGAKEESENLVEGVRAAVEEAVPVQHLDEKCTGGLLYVDSFGDVRILGRRFLEWLPALGVDVSAAMGGGAVPSGVLTLAQRRNGFAEEAGAELPSLSEIGEAGMLFEVDAPMAEKVPSGTLKFSVRRLDKVAEPDRAAGFVASLLVMEHSQRGDPENLSRLPVRGDPLVVFSLAEQLPTIMRSAVRRCNGNVRLQTPREPAHVVAHLAEFSSAPKELPVEAARHDTSQGGPVISVRERRHRVELSVLELRTEGQLGCESPSEQGSRTTAN